MERNLRMSLKEWLPFFGVVLMLASCTEDERLPQTEDGYGLKLESVSLYEGGTSTRALLTDVDAVGLYLTKQNHAEYGSNPRCVYTRAGGGWSAGDNAPKINSANGGDATVYAFHPSGLTITREASGNHTVPVSVVAADDFLAASQTDYLLNWHSSTTAFGPYAVTTSNRSLSLSLKHTLAKVSLRVLKSEAATEKLTLKKVEILSPTNRIQIGNGVMNLATGALSGLSSTSQLTLTHSAGMVLATNSTAPNVTCLAAPMAASEPLLSFRLTVDVLPAGAGTPAELVFETGVVGTPQQWKAGKHYVYKVTVDKMGGGFSGVQMEDWQNDASQNTSIGI